MTSKSAALAILLIALAGVSHAQRGVIYGRLSDPSGAPLKYSNILLETTTFGALTDVHGRYWVEAPAGTYVVKTMTQEFETETQSARLGRGDSLRVDFVLRRPKKSEPIKEIRVYAPGRPKEQVVVHDVISPLGPTNIERRPPASWDPNQLVPMDSILVVYHSETKPVRSSDLEFKLRYEMFAVGDSVQVTVFAEASNIGQSPIASCGCFSFWKTQFVLGPEQGGDIPIGSRYDYKGPFLKVAPVECSSPALDCVATTLSPGAFTKRTMSFFFRPAAFATKTGELHIRCFYFSGRDGMAWEDSEHVDMGWIAVPLRTLGTSGRYLH